MKPTEEQRIVAQQATGNDQTRTTQAAFNDGWNAAIAAHEAQRGKVEPVAWRVFTGEWEYFSTQVKAQRARDAFECGPDGKPDTEHDEAEAVYTLPQAEKAPSPSVIRESRTTEFDGAPSVQAVKCCYGGMKPAGACGDCAGARPAAAPQQPSVPDAAIASEQEKGKS